MFVNLIILFFYKYTGFAYHGGVNKIEALILA